MTPPVPAQMPLPAIGCIKASFVSAIVQPLLSTPVLGILDKLERTLDVIDIEGLRMLWDHSGKTLDLGHGEPQPDIAEWTSFVDTYLRKAEHIPKSLNPGDLRYYMLAYLLSATFKDCSIIIRRDGPLDIVDYPGKREAKSTVSIIDLDTKAVERLAKWEKLDRKIVKAYAELDESRQRNCCDGHEEFDP